MFQPHTLRPSGYGLVAILEPSSGDCSRVDHALVFRRSFAPGITLSPESDGPALQPEIEIEGLAPSPRLWLPGRHPVYPGMPRSIPPPRLSEVTELPAWYTPVIGRFVLKPRKRPFPEGKGIQRLPIVVSRPFRARMGRAVPFPPHARVKRAFQAVAALRASHVWVDMGASSVPSSLWKSERGILYPS